MKPNSVLSILRYHKVLTRNVGRDIETEMAAWFVRNKIKAVRQKGDAPFDFLVSGQKIEIKSARLHTSKSNRHRHTFAMLHKNSSNLSIVQKADWIYFVFNDDDPVIYRCKSSDIPNSSNLHIDGDPKTSKYPLQFVGHLRSEVI